MHGRPARLKVNQILAASALAVSFTLRELYGIALAIAAPPTCCGVGGTE
jgi:hypothetical protein